MRQDPPFDMQYITATYILEIIKNKTLIVNDPFWVRNSTEKFFPMDFPELIPPTIVTSNVQDLADFRKEYKDIVIKPLYSFGGFGMFHVPKEDRNFYSIIETLSAHYKTPLIAQKYLPDVRKGDKRFIFADGELVGYFARVPDEKENRTGLRTGSKKMKIKPTKRDMEICKTLKPELKKRGMIIVGIDVIGDYLTEINVTSPTGFIQTNELCNVNCEKIIWDKIEQKL